MARVERIAGIRDVDRHTFPADPPVAHHRAIEHDRNLARGAGRA